jgi:hypothetical protein
MSERSDQDLLSDIKEAAQRIATYRMADYHGRVTGGCSKSRGN